MQGKRKSTIISDCARLGGEGEIRTLEPFYRLHDFQSCALDQLGDFSKYFVLAISLDGLDSISQTKGNVNSFLKIFQIFSKNFTSKNSFIFLKKGIDIFDIYGIMVSEISNDS